MHEATQALREEHEIILKVLYVAEQVAKKLNDGVAVEPVVLADILEFLRTFADRNHHGKEEDLLFPALERAGLPVDGGPIAVMLMEHTQGRELIREMVEAAEQFRAGKDEAGFQWATAAEEYTDLLRSHIYKENNILFTMAEHILRPEDQEQLNIKFKEIENSKVGAEKIRALRVKANELAISQEVARTEAYRP